MNRNFEHYVAELNSSLIALAKSGRDGSPLFITTYRSVCQRVESLERQGMGPEHVTKAKRALNQIYDRFSGRFEGKGITKYELNP